jgi:hypothetical protein
MTLGAPIMTKVPPPRFYSGSTMFASARAFASSAVLKRFARIASPDLRPETPPRLSWRKAANEKAPPQIRNPVAPELCTNNALLIRLNLNRNRLRATRQTALRKLLAHLSGSNASGILETAEHALDLVAVPIGSRVMRKRFAAIDFVGNDRRGAAPGQPVAERGTIVSLVGQQFLMFHLYRWVNQAI